MRNVQTASPRSVRRAAVSRSGRPLRGATLWLLMGLPALLLALFFYAPMASVLSGGVRTPDGHITLQRISLLLSDPYILRLIRFTAWQALLSSLLSTLIGIPMAYILARREFFGRSLLSALTMVPFVLPSITVALGFLLMFGTNGWFNHALDALFGVKVHLLHSLWAILLAHAFYNAPIVARTTQSAWEQLDPRIHESARSLGAPPWGVWRDVTLPAILPAVLSGSLLAFIFSFLSFPIVLALGGARYSTLEVEIYTQMRVLWDQEMGAALAALQAVISLSFAYFLLRAQGRTAAFAGKHAAAPRRPLLGTSRSIRSTLKDAPLWLFIAAALLLFLGPIFSVVIDSLRGSQGGLSTASYLRLLSLGHNAHVGSAPLHAIENSLRFGIWAASIALVAGATFTYGLTRGMMKRRPALETLAMAPLVVSSVALGYGFLIAFRHPPLDAITPDGRVIMVHGVLAFPFVLRTLRPTFESVDLRLTEAARTLGASALRAFRDVELPLLARSLVVAFAFSFALSISEMSATMMLARPGTVTMPVSVYRLLAARDFQAASAMAVLLVLVTAGCFLMLELVTKSVRREGKRAGSVRHES